MNRNYPFQSHGGVMTRTETIKVHCRRKESPLGSTPMGSLTNFLTISLAIDRANLSRVQTYFASTVVTKPVGLFVIDVVKQDNNKQDGIKQDGIKQGCIRLNMVMNSAFNSPSSHLSSYLIHFLFILPPSSLHSSPCIIHLLSLSLLVLKTFYPYNQLHFRTLSLLCYRTTMAPPHRIQTFAQRAGRLRTCVTRVIQGSTHVLEYVENWETERKAVCHAAEQENTGHPNHDLAVTSDALNTLLTMETQLEGLPQVLQDRATNLVKEAEDNLENWEELEELCKVVIEEREDQRKHLLIAVKAKIEMFREIHEASEEIVPPPPLSPQQVLHIMAESIDAPNQEPVVTSPMKFPLYNVLLTADKAEKNLQNGNSGLLAEQSHLPNETQQNLDEALGAQTRVVNTPILTVNNHNNPELGGAPAWNVTNQRVEERQIRRQNINEINNNPAATGIHRLIFNSPPAHKRGGNQLLREYSRRNNSTERFNPRNTAGYTNFGYNEENHERQYHDRNVNGNAYSEYYQHQRQSRLEHPTHLYYQSYQNNQYPNQQNQAFNSQGTWKNYRVSYNRCEVCNGDHEITVCTEDKDMVARVCIANGKCPKCRAGNHQVYECPLLYLEKEQARTNKEKIHSDSRSQNRLNYRESNEDDRYSSHQQRSSNQPKYTERQKEIAERDLARYVANIKPFTGIISEYASFRNIMADYLESETVSLVVRRDTLMQKISGEAAVQKSILDDPGKAIDITMKNLDRTYKRKGSTTIRNQFEKVIVTDENIDAFIKSLALSKSLHDKILEEEPHGFGYHSAKALLGRMPDAVRRMCNRMLRDETLSTEKIYEKAEEHLDNQIEDAEITGKSTNQTRVSRDQQH